MTSRVWMFLMFVSLVGFVGCAGAPDKEDDGKSSEEAKAMLSEKDGAEEGAEKEGAAAREGAAEKEGEGEEAEGGLTCKSVVTNAVTVLYDAQGDDAFFEKEDIPKLTEGCKAAGTLEKSAETARCLNEVEGVDGMKKCEGANLVMKKWAENAPSGDAKKEEKKEEPKK